MKAKVHSISIVDRIKGMADTIRTTYPGFDTVELKVYKTSFRVEMFKYTAEDDCDENVAVVMNVTSARRNRNDHQRTRREILQGNDQEASLV